MRLLPGRSSAFLLDGRLTVNACSASCEKSGNVDFFAIAEIHWLKLTLQVFGAKIPLRHRFIKQSEPHISMALDWTGVGLCRMQYRGRGTIDILLARPSGIELACMVSQRVTRMSSSQFC